MLIVTICEVKGYNRVSFNILVNCREQFFLFPQNLKFLNTFLVFLTIPIRFDLPRPAGSNITKPENPHLILVHVVSTSSAAFPSY